MEIRLSLLKYLPLLEKTSQSGLLKERKTEDSHFGRVGKLFILLKQVLGGFQAPVLIF